MALARPPICDFGWQAVEFDLPGVDGRNWTLADAAGERGTVVMFICNHCPFVKHVLGELGRLDADYSPGGVRFVAINSNDLKAHPDDSPEHMRALAESRGWTFPFLFDASQGVARAFRAACTPDFYVFDRGGALVYRGQLDDSRPSNGLPVSGQDLRAAIDAVISNGPVAQDQRASIGCSIKWRAGNEPAYA
jgi:thiol-disulfide isomerase/thioredoxin